jgi:guanylate kinase
MASLEEEVGIEETALLLSREKALKDENKAFFSSHPEAMHLLNTMLSSMLLQQPDDVFHFASSFFFRYIGQRATPRRRPLVLCGPRGVGKSELAKMLLAHFPYEFAIPVAHTTRPRRDNELHGVDFHFVSEAEYERLEEAGDLAVPGVCAEGYPCSVSFSAIGDVADNGKIAILEVSPAISAKLQQSNLHARYAFIQAPSVNELERRLRIRGTDAEKAVLQIMQGVLAEMESADVQQYDKLIENEVLREAFDALKLMLKDELKNAKEFEPLKQRRPCVLAGSFGVRLEVLQAQLLSLKETFVPIIRHTSCPPNESAVDGVDFFFADQFKMESMILNSQLLEFERDPKTSAITGSSVQAAQAIKRDGGLIALLRVDKESALKMPRPADLDIQFVWVSTMHRPNSVESINSCC